MPFPGTKPMTNLPWSLTTLNDSDSGLNPEIKVTGEKIAGALKSKECQKLPSRLSLQDL
jgi:hypothetical protein